MGLVISLLVIVIGLVALAARSSDDSLKKLQKQDPTGSESKRVQIAIVLIRASVMMSLVDGRIDDEEISQIRKFFLHHGADIEFMSFVNAQLLESLELVKKQGADQYFETIVSTVRRSGLDTDELYYLGDALAGVMAADGRVEEEELAFLFLFLRKSGLSEEDVATYFNHLLPEEDDTEDRVRAQSLLGLGDEYSAEEVKAAFRSQSLRYHPDKVEHLGQEFSELANERMQELVWARDVLLNAAAEST